ncbi:hypothetical protein [Pedococcus sp. 5OH_020]|nr:hypothetical protein [Pedococcus sp. 5OH_020]
MRHTTVPGYCTGLVTVATARRADMADEGSPPAQDVVEVDP